MRQHVRYAGAEARLLEPLYVGGVEGASEIVCEEFACRCVQRIVDRGSWIEEMKRAGKMDWKASVLWHDNLHSAFLRRGPPGLPILSALCADMRALFPVLGPISMPQSMLAHLENVPGLISHPAYHRHAIQVKTTSTRCPPKRGPHNLVLTPPRAASASICERGSSASLSTP